VNKKTPEEYWRFLQDNKDTLLHYGALKLPPLSDVIDSSEYLEGLINEASDKTYTEASTTHQKFMSDVGVTNLLAPILHSYAKEFFGFKGNVLDQYHISRYVQPGSKNKYETHFDSHIFTIVFPLHIPKVLESDDCGQLLYKLKCRPERKSEVINILEKAYYKRYANKESAEKLVKDKYLSLEDFSDGRPLIFLGRSTLHTNRSVDIKAEHGRLTVIAHFFDPSPVFGIGNILRMLRKR